MSTALLSPRKRLPGKTRCVKPIQTECKKLKEKGTPKRRTPGLLALSYVVWAFGDSGIRVASALTCSVCRHGCGSERLTPCGLSRTRLGPTTFFRYGIASEG